MVKATFILSRFYHDVPNSSMTITICPELSYLPGGVPLSTRDLSRTKEDMHIGTVHVTDRESVKVPLSYS